MWTCVCRSTKRALRCSTAHPGRGRPRCFASSPGSRRPIPVRSAATAPLGLPMGSRNRPKRAAPGSCFRTTRCSRTSPWSRTSNSARVIAQTRRSFSNASGWRSCGLGVRARFRAARRSVWRWRARLPPSLRCCCSTNRFRLSIRQRVTVRAPNFAAHCSRAARPPSWSRTIAAKPSPWPIGWP